MKINRDAGDQPIFVAAKLDSLPRYSPEEIDLKSVVERINDLERKFARLDHTVAKLTDTMAMILDAQCRRGYADAPRQLVSEQFHNARSVVNENPRQPPGPQVAGPVQELNFEQHRAEQALQDTESSDADDTGAGDPVIDVNNSGSEGEAPDGFVLPREQIKRQNRRNNANNQNKIVFGKGGAGGLTASARTREIFVFNLSGDTSDDDLQSFFVKINVTVAELECRTKPDALARSYRVRIALDDIAKVMNPDIWPEGATCITGQNVMV